MLDSWNYATAVIGSFCTATFTSLRDNAAGYTLFTFLGKEIKLAQLIYEMIDQR